MCQPTNQTSSVLPIFISFGIPIIEPSPSPLLNPFFPITPSAPIKSLQKNKNKLQI